LEYKFRFLEKDGIYDTLKREARKEGIKGIKLVLPFDSWSYPFPIGSPTPAPHTTQCPRLKSSNQRYREVVLPHKLFLS
jgi:hypothetical protein